MKKTWVFSLQTSILILFLFSSILFSPVLFQYVDQKFEELRDQTILELEKQLGKNLSYHYISPSIFQFLEIRDLQIYDQEPGDFVQITNLKVYYNIWGLLFGDIDQSIQEIRMENSAFVVDLERDDSILQNIRMLMDGEEDGTIPQWRLSGRNLDFTLVSEFGSYTLEKTSFDWESRPKDILLSLKTTLVGLDFMERSYRAELNIAGNFLPDLSSGVLRTNIQKGATPFFLLDQLAFQISFNQNQLRVTKIQDLQPWDLDLNLDFQSGNMTGSLQGRDFIPRNFLTLAGPLAPANSFLASSFTGDLNLQWNLERGRGNYQYDITRLSIPPSALGERLTLRLLGFGDQSSLSIKEFTLRNPSGDAGFSGRVEFADFLPQGIFRFNNFGPLGIPKITGLIDANKKQQTVYQLFSKNLVLGTTELEELNLNYTYQAPIPDFELFVGIPLTGSTSGLGIVQLEGLLPLGQNNWSEIRGSLYLDRIQVRALLGMLGNNQKDLVEILTPLESFLISNSSDFSFEKGQLSSTGYRLLFEDGRNLSRRIESSYLLEPDRLSIEPIDIRWEDFAAQARSVILWPQEGGVEIRNQFSTSGISYAVDVLVSPDFQNVTFDGDYGLQGAVNTEQNGTIDFSLGTQNLPLPLPGGSWSISLQANGFWKSESDFFLNLEKSSFAYIPADQTQTWDLTWEGTLEPQEIHLTTLSVGVLEQNYEGSLLMRTREGDLWSSDIDLLLVHPDGSRLQIDGFAGLGSSDLLLSLREINLTNLPFGIDGRLGGEVEVQGALFNPIIDYTARLTGGRIGEDSIAFDSRGSFYENKLDISRLNFTYVQTSLSNFRGTINTDSFTVNGQGTLSTRLGPQTLWSEFVITTNEDRSNMDTSTFQNIVPITGELSLRRTSFGNKAIPNQSIRFFRFQDTISFQGGQGNSINGRFRDNGSFSLNLAAPSPLIFSASGVIAGGQINGNIENLKGELSEIGDYFSFLDLKIASGRLGGILGLSGPVGDPEIRGFISITDLNIVPPVIQDEITDESFRLDFRGRRIEIREDDTMIGLSPVTIRGDFLFDHWGINSWKIGIAIPPFAPINTNLSIIGLSFDGGLTGDLNLSGDMLDFRLSGNLLLQDMQIGLNLEEQEEEESFGLNTFIDLKVRTGRSVSFLWPNDNFPIILAFTDPGQELTMLYDDLDGSFFLKGDLQIRGGEINYLNRRFLLRSGSISLNENSNKFDPRIDITGELRTRSADGPVRLILTARGLLSQFSPRFSSIPSMTPEELAALIGTTVVLPEEYIAFDTDSAISFIGDVGTTVLLRPFEERIREFFDLDIFAFRTDIVKRALMNQGEEISFQDYIDNTSLFLGKYLGDDLFVEGLVSFKSEDALTGDAEITQEILTELELGLELKTPLFLLNWRFNPTNPENLFLTDNEISLSWEFIF